MYEYYPYWKLTLKWLYHSIELNWINHINKINKINENFKRTENKNDIKDVIFEKYNVDFEFSDKNTLPKGRFSDDWQCYEWLKRVNDTCKTYDSKWIVIFEDDVVTQSSNFIEPKYDSAGAVILNWRPELSYILMTNNKKNINFGYGMCGGTVFNRECFIDCYDRISQFDISNLKQFDNRIAEATDSLVSCFIQYFGYNYGLWECVDDITWFPNKSVAKSPCFLHAYKNLY